MNVGIARKGHPAKPQGAISDVLEWHHVSPQLHANQKPLGAISKLLNCYSPEDAIVLDPFCGSGTTLVAARNSGRRAIGIEIEECFYEIAALRLSQQVLDFPDTEVSVSQQGSSRFGKVPSNELFNSLWNQTNDDSAQS
jgi:DNA methylase